MSQFIKTSLVLTSLNRQLQAGALNRLLTRSYATHWDPKFKELRKAKVVKVKFPDFDEIKNNDMFNMTAEEKRARSIKEGIEPPISFEYKPINITTSSNLKKIQFKLIQNLTNSIKKMKYLNHIFHLRVTEKPLHIFQKMQVHYLNNKQT